MENGGKVVAAGAVAAVVAIGVGKTMIEHPAIITETMVRDARPTLSRIGAGTAAVRTETGIAATFTREERASFQEFLVASPEKSLSYNLPKVFARQSSGFVQDLNRSYAFFDAARPQIVIDIGKASKPVTQEAATQIISRDVAEAVGKSAEKSKVEFDVLTGELKIKNRLDLIGISFGVGNFNLYKAAALTATGVVACNKLAQNPSYESCIDAAITKARGYIVKSFLGEQDANYVGSLLEGSD
jgi:hypothetical protein